MGVAFNPFTGDLQLLNSSTAGISTVTSDPSSPNSGDVWILHSSTAVGGNPIGLLLALTQTYVVNQYLLSYRTPQGTTVRMVLQ